MLSYRKGSDMWNRFVNCQKKNSPGTIGMTSRAGSATAFALAVIGVQPVLAQSPVIIEASTNDGTTWSSAVTTNPGTRVTFRVRVQDQSPFIGHTGLAGLVFQPTLTNFRPSDTADPVSPVAGVGPTGRGRLNPWAFPDMGPSSAPGVLTPFVDPGNVLRFAGANAIFPPPVPFGVQIGQPSAVVAGTNFVFDTDVVVFQYSVVLTDPTARTLVASTPIDLILGSRIQYYTSETGTTEEIRISGSDIAPATVTIIPAPATLSSILGFAAAMSRRRRSAGTYRSK
jgi:hypothetical protein